MQRTTRKHINYLDTKSGMNQVNVPFATGGSAGELGMLSYEW